jgi:phosphatidate cytidylyltransferase
MSPGIALHNEVFRFYFWLTLGLLAVAGFVLSVMRWGLKKEITSIWRTYCSWLVMAPLLLGCVFAGRIATIVGVTLVAALGFKEFARATGLYRDWWMTGAVYAGIVSVAASSLLLDPGDHSPGWFGFFMAAPVFAIAFILLVPIARNQTAGQLQSLSLAIVGFVYIGWMFGHLGFFANSDHPYGYLLYLIFAVEVNDVAAFTCGKLFGQKGRHKFRSNISPNKTWEGAIGALLVSLALPWALRFSFPHFGPAQFLWTGVIVGIGGQLGDLSISVIKRDIGIKDMGAMIPGHGGILDRIDSLIYTAPLFFHMVNYYYNVKP